MFEIPYKTEVRSDTGMTNGQLGIWLFLASEVMLFGGLFSAYFLLRFGAPEPWSAFQEHLNVPLATLNTVVLILSSVTVVLAWDALATLKNTKRSKLYLISTIVLGVLFLCFKSFEYYQKFSHHIYPSENNFYGIYFVLTGLHILHVIGGLIFNIYFCSVLDQCYKKDPKTMVLRLEVAGLYWHFVDIVWIILFPILYLA